MAANDPSYFKSTPVQQVVQQKELRFHLYVFQHHVEGSDGQNQRTITDLKLPNYFGLGYVNDWIIRDGPSASANIVARAQGLHLGAGMDEDNWFICFNLIFTDERFKGSCLQVLGNLRGRDGEWAVMGGTGEFAFAQGVATFKEFGDISRIAIRELHIHVMCLGFPEPVHVTKIGQWGGNGGKEFDIPESVPQRLESVTIRSGVVINSIAFSYVDQARKKQTLGPWGGDGELSDTIPFAPLEIMKEVAGTTGTFGGDIVVTSLTFVTNVRSYGPFGKPNGTAFSVPLMDTNVVGFFVRAGKNVNALGVYARPSIQN